MVITNCDGVCFFLLGVLLDEVGYRSCYFRDWGSIRGLSFCLVVYLWCLLEQLDRLLFFF